MRWMDVYGGAILAAASDGARIVNGGDAGELGSTDLGPSRFLAADARHRWIDHAALGPDSAGRRVALPEQRSASTLRFVGGS